MQLDQDHIWHPFGLLEGLNHELVERSEKASIHLKDGRIIIDAISSWWVNIHGHSHPHIIKALQEQAEALQQVIFAGFTHEPAIRIVARLIQIMPGAMKRAFFSDNGSTAVEVGVKMAIQYWYNLNQPKEKIIVIEGAYHGDTFGAMSLSGKSSFYKPFFNHLFEVQVLPFPNGENEVEQFKKLVKNKDVAAFVYEPLVQGSAGMRIYASEILQNLLEVAKAHEVICVADEVMTGFGRTGKRFASEYQTVYPDIMCISKGLTGGYMPMSMTFCNEQIESAFLGDDKLRAFYHGHSFTANPLACAVANASLDVLLEDETTANINRINKRHQEACAHFSAHSCVQDVKSLGTILSIEIRTGEQTSYFNNLRDWLYNEFMNLNLLLRPLGNIIYVMPPYCITDEELTRVYNGISKTLDKLAESF